MLDNNGIQDFFRAKLLKYLLSIMRPSTHTLRQRTLNFKKEIARESNAKFETKRSTSFIVNSNIALLMGFPGKIERYFLLFIEDS